MQKKKGFTLIELLGVLTLLAVIALIAVLAINKNIKDGKQRMYKKQIETIELAAKNWAVDHYLELPDDKHSMAVTLRLLKINGYIGFDVNNPINGDCFSNNVRVLIYQENGKYNYKIDESSIAFNQYCDDYNNAIPTIEIVSNTDSVGKNQEFQFLVTSNVPFKKDDIEKSVELKYLEYSYTDTAGTELGGTNHSQIISISEVVENVENGVWECSVVVKSGDAGEEVYLEANEGTIQVSGILSSKKDSNRVYVDIIPPTMRLNKARAEAFDGYGGFTLGDNPEYNFTSQYYCMDWYGGFSQNYKFYTAGYKINLSITENESNYVEITKDIDENKGAFALLAGLDFNNKVRDFEYIIQQNQKFSIRGCDGNGNCTNLLMPTQTFSYEEGKELGLDMTGPSSSNNDYVYGFTNKFNDCVAPSFKNNDSDLRSSGKLLSESFVDEIMEYDVDYENVIYNGGITKYHYVASGIKYIGAFVSRYSSDNLDATNLITMEIVESEYWLTSVLEKFKKSGGIVFGPDDIKGKTIEDIYISAISQITDVDCGVSYYLWLVAVDYARNISYVSFEILNGNDEMYCQDSSIIEQPELPELPVLDFNHSQQDVEKNLNNNGSGGGFNELSNSCNDFFGCYPLNSEAYNILDKWNVVDPSYKEIAYNNIILTLGKDLQSEYCNGSSLNYCNLSDSDIEYLQEQLHQDNEDMCSDKLAVDPKACSYNESEGTWCYFSYGCTESDEAQPIYSTGYIPTIGEL